MKSARFCLGLGWVCLWFFIPCSTNPVEAQGQATVRVKTVQSANLYDYPGKPAGGIRFQIGSQHGMTDASGNATVVIAPGTYFAEAEMPCAQTYGGARSFTFQAGKTYDVEFRMYTDTGCRVLPARTSRVRILTTQSCTDAEGDPVTAQGGVSVSLGGETFTSNDKGVIEADLPFGTYPVAAAWKDYPLGFVRQANTIMGRPAEGAPSVILSRPEEILEVRIFTCDPRGLGKPRAVITEIGLSIKVRRSRAEGNAFVGMQLRDGDLVTIKGTAKLKWLSNNGIVSFEAPGTAVIRIGPDEVPSGSKPYEGACVMEVLRGVAAFLFLPRVRKEHICTGGCYTGVKGTTFSVAHDDQTQVSTIAVQEGVVAVTPRNPALRPFDLRAGQQAQVSLNNVSPITAANPAVSPVGRAPGWSRGQQLLSITYDECVGRAKSALQAESYRIDHAGGNFAVGVKEAHTAVIMCNPVGAKEVVNIVVMSNGGGGGDQRGRLQARMEGGAPPPATATAPDPVTRQPQPHAQPAEAARPIDWTTSVNKLDIPPGQRRAFTCSAIDPSSRFSFREREGIYWFPVWGTDIYETDSHICPAAVHAGIISFQSGGTATIEVLRSDARIHGSRRNGIGSYTSFREKTLDSLAFRFVTGAHARVPQGVTPPIDALPPLGPDRDGWTFNSSTATNLRFFGSASVASCRAECEKESKCMAFSWIKPGGYQPGDPPMCYLLSSWAGLVEHSCCISAVRN